MMKNKGFTLLELVSAMAIGVVMLAAVYGAVNVVQRSTTGIERKVIAQQDAKSVLELMAMEIRMASYDQNMDTSIWVDPANCNGDSANPTYRGIQAATPFSLTIEMDINDSGGIDDTNSNRNETIKYVYDAANQYITRSTNCGNNDPFLGDTVTGKKTVRVLNDQNGNGVYDAGTDVPVFRYFNGAGVEIFPGTTPSTIPTIRTIEIILALETEDVDPSTNQRRRLVYSTRVMPRNHAISQ
jgi:prepilin-type N-terminal cleavage/methylation domain-containing protein